ncbi:MAG TPA: hypothetical protein VJY62_00140, partial [Bacteroidia bacterium]|nr:hypothetical protein [Bacteroidia bacterium]
MKKISLFILTGLWTGLCFSQPLMQKTIGGSASDEAAKVIATSDGGFASIGSTQSFGAGQSDLLFIKYDSLLNIQWARAYGSVLNDYGTSCVELANGNFMLAGYSYGYSIDTSYSDMLIIRISSTGLVQWAKTAGGFQSEDAWDISLTTDSYVVLAGSTISNFQPTTQSAYAAKFDLNGNSKWIKAYYTDSISYFKSVSATAGGGVAFAGSCRDSGSSTYDIYVVQADTGGFPVWQKKYGGINSEYANGIKHLSTAELLVTGLTESFGAGGWDACLLKLDASGNSKWLTTYGTGSFEKGNSVVENLFGLYILCGNAAGNSKGLMIRADTSGALLNRKIFGDSIGNSIANSLAVTVDSGFVITGRTESFGAANGDIYLLKSDRVLNTTCYQSSPTFISDTYTPFDSVSGSSVSAGTSLYVTAQIITTAVTLNQNIICGPVGIDEHSV